MRKPEYPTSSTTAFRYVVKVRIRQDAERTTGSDCAEILHRMVGCAEGTGLLSPDIPSSKFCDFKCLLITGSYLLLLQWRETASVEVDL
jgi:hypothetical protein